MANEFIGRRIAVGLGSETERGTAVPATHWQKHLELSFQSMSEAVNNESALGVVEQINDSTIARKWSEGALGGKITDDTIGVLLKSTFGDITSAETADTGVFTHDFSIMQTNTPPTLTIARVDPVANLEYARGTIGTLEVTNNAGEFVMFSANIFSEQGSTSTNTPAFVAENEFTSKDLVVKVADTEGGLTGALPIPASALTLTIEKNAEPYFAMGALSPTEITTGSVTITGELTIRYTSQEYEDMYFGASKKWLSISMINTDVTIGASSNPTVSFLLPQAVFTEWTLNQGLDDIVEQTLGFTGQYSAGDAYAITAQLINTTASY